jgi:hypothetical protein
MQILAIGLGDWVDKYELQALASDSYDSTLFLVPVYTQLVGFVNDFKAILCNGESVQY